MQEQKLSAVFFVYLLLSHHLLPVAAAINSWQAAPRTQLQDDVHDQKINDVTSKSSELRDAVLGHVDTLLSSLDSDSLKNYVNIEDLFQTLQPHTQDGDKASHANNIEDVLRQKLSAMDASLINDSPLVMSSLYSLLEVSSRLQDADSIHATQFFELIEDPIMNLLVPVAVDVVIAIIRMPILLVLSEIIGYVLAKLLAEPLGTAIWPGADTSKLAKIAEVMTPKSAYSKSSMSKTTTTTTIVEEDAFIEADATLTHGIRHPGLETAFVDLSTAHALLRTQCGVAKEERACLGLSPPTSQGRCNWCVQQSAGGTAVGVCSACDAAVMDNFKKNGYQCKRSLSKCGIAPSPSVSPSTASKPAKNADSKVSDAPDYPQASPAPSAAPPANEAAAQLVRLIADMSTGPLSHLLHNEIVPVLRQMARDKVVRGTLRSLLPNVTRDVMMEVQGKIGTPLIRSTAAGITKRVGRTIVEALPLMLVPALTEALTHDPVADYVCAYCRLNNQYCATCDGYRQEELDMQHIWNTVDKLARTAAIPIAGPLGDALADIAFQLQADGMAANQPSEHKSRT